MQHFFKKLFSFVAFFTVSYVLLLVLVAASTFFTPFVEKNWSIFGQESEFGATYYRSNELYSWLNKPAKEKGLIIGSSTSYKNVNPFILDTITNIDWFNVSSSAQTPDLSFLLLKEANKNHDIHFVLLNIFSGVFEKSASEPIYDWVVNGKDINALKTKMIFDLRPEFRIIHQYLYRLIKSAIHAPIHLNHRTDGTYMGKGFLCCDVQKPLDKYTTQTTYSFNKAKSVNNVEKIIEYCKNNNIQIILNPAPVLGERNDFDSVFKKYSIAEVHDFSNPSDFYDSHHFVCSGSTKYTLQLGGILKQMIARH